MLCLLFTFNFNAPAAARQRQALDVPHAFLVRRDGPAPGGRRSSLPRPSGGSAATAGLGCSPCVSRVERRPWQAASFPPLSLWWQFSNGRPGTFPIRLSRAATAPAGHGRPPSQPSGGRTATVGHGYSLFRSHGARQLWLAAVVPPAALQQQDSKDGPRLFPMRLLRSVSDPRPSSDRTAKTGHGRPPSGSCVARRPQRTVAIPVGSLAQRVSRSVTSLAGHGHPPADLYRLDGPGGPLMIPSRLSHSRLPWRAAGRAAVISTVNRRRWNGNDGPQPSIPQLSPGATALAGRGCSPGPTAAGQ